MTIKSEFLRIHQLTWDTCTSSRELMLKLLASNIEYRLVACRLFSELIIFVIFSY